MISIPELFPAGWRDRFVPQYRTVVAGFDVATTAKQTSNPSALTVGQMAGDSLFARLVLRFKSADPALTYRLIKMAADLPHGLRIQRLCIDATSERYFAVDLRRKLLDLGIVVELVDSASSILHMGEKMSMKSYLGNLAVNAFDLGRIALPECAWLRDDIRQVYRTRGTFDADVDASGNHADAFDSIKLCYHAGTRGSGPVEADGVETGQSFIDGTGARAPSDASLYKNSREYYAQDALHL